MAADRESAWRRLEEPLDLLVVGGGVTGAAILFEAARRGLRCGLLERRDFASGASSRSSKLVHGGLRYLRELRFGLTLESVREREELLREAPGLVEPLTFLMPHYPGSSPSPAALGAGLALYDVFARRRTHRYVDADEAARIAPPIRRAGLIGAHEYGDASTDDARLVLRLVQEARGAGAIALNYVDASALLERNGKVAGVRAVDCIDGRTCEAVARVTINATGASSDVLRDRLGKRAKLRPLRGSHLLLPGWRLPLAVSVAFAHPRDARPVFACPWLGATLVGTTDLDHREDLSLEAAISPDEVTYLLEALAHLFPASELRASDAICSYAGVRPVLDSGAANPSKESRDHVILDERGLITVTGGKYTTFRPMALQTLRRARRYFADSLDLAARPVFYAAQLPDAPYLTTTARRRLAGRYGSRADELLRTTPESEHVPVGNTDILWAELRFAARNESVVHLDDLLLRRTRLGLLAARGGARWLDRIGAICASELGWQTPRLERELTAYRRLHATHYQVPS